ncbi:MAG TPA: ABC transporter substrate-binding protein [Stellaceae bacterium]|nr:ABC transporter substrate-binding protein [Stellaceae bacterium]
MQLNRRWRLLLAGGLGAALLCGASHGAAAADKLRVGKAQGLAWTFLPADIGIEQGFFAKYGIEVEIVALTGDAKVQQALAAKSIDFGLGSGPGMAFAAKGSPVIAVAAFAGPPRNISAVVRADSPVKSVADLRGKLIGVSTVGSLTDWLAKQMAVQEGWGKNGVQTVPLGAIAASLAALKAHQIDASVLATEAGFQLAERGEARIVVGMDKYAPHFITHVVFARKDILAENPTLIDRFLKGFFASIAFMKTHKPQTVAAAERVLKQSPKVASETYDYEISMLTDDGRFDPKAVEVLKQSFVEMGTLDRKPADDELFTTHFVPVKP